MSNEIKLSYINQKYIEQAKKESASIEKTQTDTEPKKNGKKLLALGATALATIAIAGIAFYKHKTPTEIFDFKKLNLKGGIASFNNKLYSGFAETKLANGDRVVFKYKKGAMKSYKKYNSKNNKLIKKMYINKNGERIIEEYKGTVKDTKNLTKIKAEIQDRMKRMKELVIPQNGYDMSQENNFVYYRTNGRDTGFKDRIVGSRHNEPKKTNFRIFRTVDGKYVVEVGCQHYNETGSEVLSHIKLVSNGDKLTPAQKNLLALKNQNKLESINSPLLKTRPDEIKKPEDIFDLIAKWSQDIDVDDKKAQYYVQLVEDLQCGQGILERSIF